MVLLGLGILCVAYGCFIMLANSGSLFFIVWLMIGIICCVWGVLRMKEYHLLVPPIVRKIWMGLWIIGLCVVVITQLLIYTGFKDNHQKDVDVLLVLGAQVKVSGPSVVLKYRLDEAYTYLVDHPSTKVIVSGGKGDNEPEAEGIMMKEYLVEKGIDDSRILVEDQSHNTKENIAFSANLFDPKRESVGIVSNNFHVYRGVQLAKHAGYQNVIGMPADSTVLYLPNNLFRESFGVVKDVVFGNMKLW